MDDLAQLHDHGARAVDRLVALDARADQLAPLFGPLHQQTVREVYARLLGHAADPTAAPARRDRAREAARALLAKVEDAAVRQRSRLA